MMEELSLASACGAGERTEREAAVGGDGESGVLVAARAVGRWWGA